MPRKPTRAAVSLPKGVHKTTSRGRDYYYFQLNRGTATAGERVSLPSDPHSPEFWTAVRKAQGLILEPEVETFGVVCDLYATSPQYAALSEGTRRQYRSWLKHARAAWDNLPASGLRPKHVRALLDQLAATPGAANNVLGVLNAVCKWGIVRGHFDQSITLGVVPYKSKGGHKPWTKAQCTAAELGFSGMLRRAYFLARFTGQRGSDVVRLGDTFMDEGGFRLTQRKTGREVWIPIAPELAAEMATWEKTPGPYLRQHYGKVYSHDLLEHHFREARAKIPELRGCTLHGLRGTRVIELRNLGLTTTQIEDQIGMSLMMIQRYCRFADKKISGKASVVSLAEHRSRRA